MIHKFDRSDHNNKEMSLSINDEKNEDRLRSHILSYIIYIFIFNSYNGETNRHQNNNHNSSSSKILLSDVRYSIL